MNISIKDIKRAVRAMERGTNQSLNEDLTLRRELGVLQFLFAADDKYLSAQRIVGAACMRVDARIDAYWDEVFA